MILLGKLKRCLGGNEWKGFRRRMNKMIRRRGFRTPMPAVAPPRYPPENFQTVNLGQCFDLKVKIVKVIKPEKEVK